MKHHTFLSYSFLLSSTLLVGCGGSGTSDVTDESETPETTVPTITSSLVINEIVANAADGGNDWIELYAVEGSIDLSSYSVVDDNEEHIAQALPSGQCELACAQGRNRSSRATSSAKNYYA